eukprot:scaffold53934_cov38-Prasinocladus_malaysianus.AAC.1
MVGEFSYPAFGDLSSVGQGKMVGDVLYRLINIELPLVSMEDKEAFPWKQTEPKPKLFCVQRAKQKAQAGVCDPHAVWLMPGIHGRIHAEEGLSTSLIAEGVQAGLEGRERPVHT